MMHSRLKGGEEFFTVLDIRLDCARGVLLKQLLMGSVKVCDHALKLYVKCQLGILASESSETLTC